MSKKESLNKIKSDEIVLTGGEKEITSNIAKCPSCGANLVFSPEKQVLMCEHCGTEDAFESFCTSEKDFEKLFEASNGWKDETHVYSCDNCGAKQVVAKDEISKHCAFCGTSNVIETTELSGLKPTSIVPFAISKDNAIVRVIQWVKKKLFAPKRFKKDISPEDICGVYNPAFTFDSETSSFYHGKLGRYIYTTKQVNGKTVTERRVEYFNIKGNVGMMFDDVLIQASSTIKQKTIDKLQPFDTNNAKEYTKEFLHGYTANQYAKDGKQCWHDAKKLIDSRIKRKILSKYSYDFVVNLSISTSYQKQTFKYLLLPVYIGCLRWNKKPYNFFVNGYNGKIVGKAPLSGLKVFLTCGIILAALVAVGIVSYLLM